MRRQPSRSEIRQLILNFVPGTGGRWDWDDFTSIRYKDPLIEEVRQRCAAVQDLYRSEDRRRYCNEEGLKELRRLADLLKD